MSEELRRGLFPLTQQDEEAALRALSRARDNFLRGERPESYVRPEILRSWDRSRRAGVSPTSPLTLPSGPTVNPDSALLTAASPVVASFLQDLGEARVWIQLADRNAQIVGRWARSSDSRDMLEHICSVGSVVDEGTVGTTVLATVLEEKRPIAVWGPEHYHETLGVLSGAGAPIIHPGTGVLQGVIAVGCDLSVPVGLVLSLVTRAAGDIGTALTTGHTLADRELMDAYLRVERRGSRRPVVAISSRLYLSNLEAARHTHQLAHADLWERLRNVVDGPDASDVESHELDWGPGQRLVVRPVRSGPDLVGGVFQLVRGSRREASSHPSSGSRERPRPATNTSGPWVDLHTRVEVVVRSESTCLVHGPRRSGKFTIATRAAQAVGSHVVHVSVDDLLEGRLPPAGPRERPSCALVAHLESVDASAADVVLDQLEVLARGHSVVATCRTGHVDPAPPGWLEAAFDSVVRVPALAELSRDLRSVVSDVLGTRVDALDALVREDALRALAGRAMPGNLGQLRTVLERARDFAGSSPIGPEHLPADTATRRSSRRLTPLERIERDAIAAVLQAHDGNKVAAAEELEMPRSTFYRRLGQLGLR